MWVSTIHNKIRYVFWRKRTVAGKNYPSFLTKRKFARGSEGQLVGVGGWKRTVRQQIAGKNCQKFLLRISRTTRYSKKTT